MSTLLEVLRWLADAGGRVVAIEHDLRMWRNAESYKGAVPAQPLGRHAKGRQ